MAKKKRVSRARRVYKKIRRRAPKKFSLAIGGAFGVMPFIQTGSGSIWDNATQGNLQGVGASLAEGVLNYDVNAQAFKGLPLGPYVTLLGGAAIGHKVAGWLGINRAMAKLPAPFNKVNV